MSIIELNVRSIDSISADELIFVEHHTSSKRLKRADQYESFYAKKIKESSILSMAASNDSDDERKDGSN